LQVFMVVLADGGIEQSNEALMSFRPIDHSLNRIVKRRGIAVDVQPLGSEPRVRGDDFHFAVQRKGVSQGSTEGHLQFGLVLHGGLSLEISPWSASLTCSSLVPQCPPRIGRSVRQLPLSDVENRSWRRTTSAIASRRFIDADEPDRVMGEVE